jgi:transposase
LFSRIAYSVCKQCKIDTKFQHLDTSVMQLEGQYEGATELISFGRPKNGRSDQTHFKEVLKKLGDSMKASDDDIYHVADAALYSAKNLKELSTSPIKFVTRVPSSLSAAKELYALVDEADMQAYDENYKILPICSNYGEVKQR